MTTRARTFFAVPQGDGTTRIYTTAWNGDPPLPGECIVIERTGEQFRVLAVGPGWIDVVRRRRRWWRRLARLVRR